MDDMRQEVMHEEAVRIAKRILETGKFTYEEIAECTELSVEEIKGLDYKIGERKYSPKKRVSHNHYFDDLVALSKIEFYDIMDIRICPLFFGTLWVNTLSACEKAD